MNAKLARLKELIEQKERVDGEIAELLGEAPDKPKRHRRTKAEIEAAKQAENGQKQLV